MIKKLKKYSCIFIVNIMLLLGLFGLYGAVNVSAYNYGSLIPNFKNSDFLNFYGTNVSSSVKTAMSEKYYLCFTCSKNGYNYAYVIFFDSVPAIFYDTNLNLYYLKSFDGFASASANKYLDNTGSAGGNATIDPTSKYFYFDNLTFSNYKDGSSTLALTDPIDYTIFYANLSKSNINCNFTPYFDYSTNGLLDKDSWINTFNPNYYTDPNTNITEKFSVRISPKLIYGMSEFTSFQVSVTSYVDIFLCFEIWDDLNPATFNGTSWYNNFWGMSASDSQTAIDNVKYRHNILQNIDMENYSLMSDTDYMYNSYLFVGANTSKTFEIPLSQIPNLSQNEVDWFVYWVNYKENIGVGKGPVEYTNGVPQSFSLGFSPPEYSPAEFGNGVSFSDRSDRDSDGNIVNDDFDVDFGKLSLGTAKTILKSSVGTLDFFRAVFAVVPVEFWIIISSGLIIVVTIGIIKVIVG